MRDQAAYPELGLWLRGRLVAGGGRRTETVLDPSTGEPLGELPHARGDDLEAALAVAAEAFTTWRASSPTERSAVLRAAAALLRAEAAELAALIRTELGKPTTQAEREVDTVVELLEWAAEECRRGYGRVIPARRSGLRLTTTLEPIGPVAAFAGWNAPAITPARKISGGVAAGCPVVIKPSEATPATALFLVRALERAGLPPGVVSVVFGDPPTIADTLLRSDTIRMLTFTGSTEVGRGLAALAARTMKRMVLELGGHAPVLVFPDVDVAAVARRAAEAKFRNAGQVCTSPTRFYVHQAVYPAFVDHFAEAAAALRVGDPRDPRTQMGPLRTSQRLAAVSDLVADAVAHGATVRAGGRRLDRAGFFFAPTVLTEVSADCRVANEEPFGPIAQLAAFATTDEAVALANRLPVGLSAYVFGNNLATVRDVTERLRAGNVSVNHWVASFPETPFGGFGDSGVGVEGGVDGARAFLQTKVVSEDAGPV